MPLSLSEQEFSLESEHFDLSATVYIFVLAACSVIKLFILWPKNVWNGVISLRQYPASTSCNILQSGELFTFFRVIFFSLRKSCRSSIIVDHVAFAAIHFRCFAYLLSLRLASVIWTQCQSLGRVFQTRKIWPRSRKTMKTSMFLIVRIAVFRLLVPRDESGKPNFQAS